MTVRITMAKLFGYASTAMGILSHSIFRRTANFGNFYAGSPFPAFATVRSKLDLAFNRPREKVRRRTSTTST